MDGSVDAGAQPKAELHGLVGSVAARGVASLACSRDGTAAAVERTPDTVVEVVGH